MINDTAKHRKEFIAWLTKHEFHAEFLSTELMRFGHEVYWTLKEEEKHDT